MKNFYENLRKIRKSKGISQADMADKLGITQDGYGKMERGHIEPSFERLEQIAEALKVSVQELLFGENSQEQVEKLKIENDLLKVKVEQANQRLIFAIQSLLLLIENHLKDVLNPSQAEVILEKIEKDIENLALLAGLVISAVELKKSMNKQKD